MVTGVCLAIRDDPAAVPFPILQRLDAGSDEIGEFRLREARPFSELSQPGAGVSD